jgi:PAS domain S-box-containing protein
VNTALALLTAALSLYQSRAGASPSGRRRILGAAGAGLTLVLGVGTLVQYLTNWELGIDQLLVDDFPNAESLRHPGRMSPIAAVGMVFLGASLLARIAFPLRAALAHLLALPLLAIALLALVGYLYDVQAFYQLGPYIRIAWQTALCLGALGVAILMAPPQARMVRLLCSGGLGGMTLRRLLPAAIVIPILLGCLFLLGQERGMYGVELATALLVVANVVFFALVVQAVARSVATLEEERQRARDAAQVVSERLSLALDSAQMGTWSWDLRSDHVLASPATNRMFGLPADDQVGDTPSDVRTRIHPQDLDRVVSVLRQAIRQKTDYECEFRSLWPDGSLHWILVHGRAAYDPRTGDALSVGGVTIDVTGRREAATALENSERRFRQLADAMPQIVFAARPDGVVDYFNERWCIFTGVAPYEGGRSNFQSILHPEDAAHWLQSWERSLASGEPYEVECRFHDRRSDRFPWFLVRALPVRDDQGAVIRWFGTCTDIDLQKRALGFASQLQELTTALSRAVSVEEISEVVLSNGRRALGATRGVFAMRTSAEWLQIIRTEDVAAGVMAQFGTRFSIDGPLPMQQSARTGETLFIQSLDELKDRWPDAVPLREGTGSQAFVAMPFASATEVLGATIFGYHHPRTFGDDERRFVRVLGEQCGQALQRVRLFARLEEAVRARDDFISIASHELKTPLTSLRLRIEGIKRKLEKGDTTVLGSDRVVRLVFETDQQSLRLSRLIDDMLDVSRIRSGRLALMRERIDLGDLVHDVVARLLPELSAAGEVPVVNTSGQVVGLWDRLRMEQVVTNLLTNAARYGRGKGIEIGIEMKGPRALMTVRDHGPGVAEADRERIFDPFERAARSNEPTGLGLGLFIAKQIVSGHGGRIWVEGEREEGATFHVELPIEAPPAPEPALERRTAL